MYAGPHIKRDGLVFGYDTGANPSSNFDHRVDSRRYFKGKNTTNLQASGVAFGHNSGTYGNVVTVADAPEKGTGWKKVTVSNRGSNFRIIQWTYTSMSANLEYWHSAVFDWGNMRGKGYYINLDGSGTGQRYFYKPGGYNTELGSSISINSSLEDGRIISKIIHTAAHTHAFFINNNTYNISGLNDYFYYKEYQVEQSAYATPYVAGTRSSTESLLDLTKSTTIDVSNVSFGSDGVLTFDGTDDYIAITDLLASESIGAGTQLTISLWLNCDQYGNRMPFSTGQTGNDRIYYWTQNSVNTWRVGNYTSTTGHGALPPVGTWFNTTLVIDGTNVIGYLNGVEDYTGSYTSFTTADYATFGKHGTRNEYYFDGKIAVAKIYNRALSAQEVQQNYRAYKNRFNL